MTELAELDDLEAHLYEWLPVVSHVIPGSGITPLNVYDLTLDWWRVYVRMAQQILDAKK